MRGPPGATAWGRNTNESARGAARVFINLGGMMRTFNSGATRDNVEGKLSYMRALSPAVLQRYVEYLSMHRKQADGQVRAFDNWKKGIDQDTYLDGLLRHTKDLWSIIVGEPTSEPTTIEDLACAILFNDMGLLFELLVARGAATRENCTPAAQLKTCGDCAETLNPTCVCSNPEWRAYDHVPISSIAPMCFIPKVPA